MRNQAFSYHKFCKKPITLYTLGNSREKQLVFSRGIELRQMLVTAFLILLLLAFRHTLNPLIPQTLQLAVYVVLPWFLAGWICRKRMDGKRMDRFFVDYLRYFLRYRRTRYASGQAVYEPQMQNKQQYEPIQ